MPRVVIAAGGTAGHVVPALAVADELRARGAEPSVRRHARARRGSSSCRPPATRSRILAVRGHRPPQPAARDGRRRAGRRGRRRQRAACSARVGADAVLGGGGYVAGPVGLAAVARRTPLVLTEADSHLGLANRLLAPFARRVCLAFPIAGREGERYVVTGRPVPRAIVEADRDTARERLGVPPDAPCVLVFGGSLGARSLNLAAVEALARPGRLRAAHHRPPRLRRGAGARWATRGPDYRRARVPRLARRPARGQRPGRRPRGRLGLRDRGGGQARDPGPVSARHRRPPDRQRALDGGRRRGGGAARRRADRRAPARARCEELLGDPERLERMAAASQSLARPDAAARIADEVLARDARPRTRPSSPSRERPRGQGRQQLHFVGIGGAGMSGLALIAQRARRRGLRLRPRRDAVLRGAARGRHRAARSATTPRTPRPARSWSSPPRSRPTCPRSRRRASAVAATARELLAAGGARCGA